MTAVKAFRARPVAPIGDSGRHPPQHLLQDVAQAGRRGPHVIAISHLDPPSDRRLHRPESLLVVPPPSGGVRSMMVRATPVTGRPSNRQRSAPSTVAWCRTAPRYRPLEPRRTVTCASGGGGTRPRRAAALACDTTVFGGPARTAIHRSCRQVVSAPGMRYTPRARVGRIRSHRTQALTCRSVTLTFIACRSAKAPH